MRREKLTTAAIFFLFIPACWSANAVFAADAVITAVTPDSGPQGTYMRIEGVSFGAAPNSVLFSGTPSDTIVSWSETEIFCRVPEVSGEVSVRVERDDGAISNSVLFTVTTPDVIQVDLTNTTGIENGSAVYPFSRVQRGIDGACDGGEVIVAAGTYTGDGNRDIKFAGKAITVRSSDPNDPLVVGGTIIDCNASRNNQHRGFIFETGEHPNSVIAGLTIINGYLQASPGGAIYCNAASSPTISKCVIANNFAQFGGGVACGSGSSPVITNCIIRGNACLLFGGGIYCIGSANPTISNSTLTGNNAVFGGAVSCTSSSTPEIINCTFTGNTASSTGGGMYNFSRPRLTNCIVWGNADSSGMVESSQIYNRVADVNYSCIQDAEPNDSSAYPGIGNIDDDPLFAEPGYWGDVNDVNIVVEPDDANAVWVEGDYHLLAVSPCIDAGDPCGLYEGQVDMDGQQRVFAGRVDIGSDEAAPDIDVLPLDYSFGDVEVGSSATAMVTVSNVGNGNLTLSDITFQAGGSDDFSVSAGPPLPAVVEPDAVIDIEVTYSPSVPGLWLAVLEIFSDDPDEGLVEVQLNGSGVPGELTPSEQIAETIDFFDDSAAEGTLVGDGPGQSGENRMNALKNMIEAVQVLIDGGSFRAACGQLSAVYAKTDGMPKPPDFVTGDAAAELASKIEELMTSLGCE
ncbi:MAG TPA: choice-of-anchor D domain-containing protein [Sedimentisphaerales bacterium]|nr:choice-of-anchor D domain-containing protein [Sedimentisphaerales bacterium]